MSEKISLTCYRFAFQISNPSMKKKKNLVVTDYLLRIKDRIGPDKDDLGYLPSLRSFFLIPLKYLQSLDILTVSLSPGMSYCFAAFITIFSFFTHLHICKMSGGTYFIFKNSVSSASTVCALTVSQFCFLGLFVCQLPLIAIVSLCIGLSILFFSR